MIDCHQNRNCRRLEGELQEYRDRSVLVKGLEERGPVVVTELEVLLGRVEGWKIGPLLGVSLIACLALRAGRWAATLCR